LTLQDVPGPAAPGAGPERLTIRLSPPATRAARIPGSAADDPTTLHQYENHGIRYTRRVFVTQPEQPDLAVGGDALAAPPPPVLMIQLVGENTSNEYADAAASLSLDLDRQPLDLGLDTGLLRARWREAWIVLGAVQVPAEGTEPSTDPRHLKFRGHMPPGTSGAMTLKIPIRCVAGTTNLDWLIDLEFDEELRRAKRR
jgi:hypothetical protein